MLKFIVAFVALLCASSAHADLFMPMDRGGQIAEYEALVAASPRPIRIDGYCMSACTIKLAKGCVTRRAVLMFHSAFDPIVSGRSGPWAGMSPGGNEILMRYYPKRVAEHVRKNGWLLSPSYSKMTGAKAIALGVPECR